MNYISGAIRYVAGADADKQDEVHRLVERIKSSSLAQDRRGAVIHLTQISKESPRRQSEIGEIGLKVFYAVLDQDKQYEGNLRAIIDLLIALCASAQFDASATESAKQHASTDETAGREKEVEKARREREAREVAATNIDMFLGLPDAISLVLEHLSHENFHIRCTTLELLTAMAANSRQTLQAAILDASQGVNSICDLLDDPQQVVRSNTVLLLSVICTDSPEVSKIVAFSGVPDKLFDLIHVVAPKPENGSSLDAADDDDDNLEAAIIVQDVLELLGSLINCSGTTRTALREVSFISRVVAVLGQVMRESSFVSGITAPRANSGSLQLAILKQHTQNLLLCLSNISGLLQGNPTEAKQMADDLSATDVFNKLQSLSFLEYGENGGQEELMNREIASVRMSALRTMSALMTADLAFRTQFYSLVCSSPKVEAATPQVCTLHIMLHDRSAALRTAAYVLLRESFTLDPSIGVPSRALVNALTGSSSLMSLVQTAGADLEVDSEDEQDISIPAKYLAILAEALKDALTLYPKSSDEAGVFYSAALLSWTIIRVPGARERLLASYAHNAGNSLFPQTMRVLGNAQRNKAGPAVRIGLLSLICAWLYNSPSAVSAFLSSAMHLPMVIDMLGEDPNSDDPASVHIKGLAAVVLGICLEAADGNAAAGGEGGFISAGRGPSIVIPRGTISDVIRNHIGITVFTARLDDMKTTRQYIQAVRGGDLWQLPSKIASAESAEGFFTRKGELGHEEWYDTDLVPLIEDVYTQVATKALDLLPSKSTSYNGNLSPQPDYPSGYPKVQGSEVGPSRTMEMLLADSAKDEVLNSYKELIKGQDENLSAAQHKIESLERALRELEEKLSASNSSPGNPDQAIEMKAGRVENTVPSNYSELANGPSTALANGFSSEHDRSLADEVQNRKELEDAVAFLEEQILGQKEESQTLLHELDNSRRQQEDWRRQAEESSDLVDREREDKRKALIEISLMRANAQVQADEIGAANRRVSDLETRCSELTEMRNRTEEEVSRLKEEVTLRAEQSIEISGKLYEAEEKIATLEEARDKYALSLSTAEDDAKHAFGAASGTAEPAAISEKLEELEALRSDLAQSNELNSELNARISSLTKVSERHESLQNVNHGLVSELDELRANNMDLSQKYAALTESFDSFRNESVSRNDFCSLQEQLEGSRQELSTLQGENALLKHSIQAMERTIASHTAPNAGSNVPKRPRHFESASSVSESFDSHSETGQQLGEALLQHVLKATGTQTTHLDSHEASENASNDSQRLTELHRSIAEFATIAKQSCAELALAEASLRELNVDRKAMQSRIRDLETEVGTFENQLSVTKDEHSKRLKELNFERERAVDEKGQFVSSIYEKEIDVLSSKVAQVEAKHLGLLKTKEALESNIEEMRRSEARLLEDNRQVLELLEKQHKKEIRKSEEVVNSLQKDLAGLLQKEREKSTKLQAALNEKYEHLGEAAAQYCCSSAAFQATEEALRVESSRNAVLMTDLKSVRATVKDIEEALSMQTVAASQNRECETSVAATLQTRAASLESELEIAKQKLEKEKVVNLSRVKDLEEDVKLANQSVEATKRMYEASEASANASSEKALAVLAAVRTELSSAEAEIEHKSKLIRSLKEESEVLEQEHNAVVLELTSKLEGAIRLERESAKAAVSELNVKVADLTKARDELAERAKVLSRRLQGAESSIAELNARVAALLKESAETSEKLSVKSRLLGEKNMKYQNLADDLAMEKQTLSSLQAKHVEVSRDRSALAEENVKLKVSLTESQEDVKSKQAKLKNAEQDSLDLRAWVAELETKAADLQKAATHFEDVEKNLNDAMETHKQALATISELRTELQGVKSELSSAVAASRTALRMKDEAVDEVASQRKQVMELESRLRGIRDEHTEKLRSLEESMRLSAKRCAELETSMATAERKLAENANLSDQLYASESERSQLTRANQSLRVRAEAADEQVEVMRRQVESLRQELAEFGSSSSANAFKNLEAEHNELLVCLAEMEMECASLKLELGRS